MTTTPIERIFSEDLWIKREDLFSHAGVYGGKVRTCLAIASAPGALGLVTAGARHSPQVHIVAAVGKSLGLPVRCHVPRGEPTPELREAEALGAELVHHRAGYNTVIVARAREDAERTGYRLIPFGMDHPEAVEQTAAQVPDELPATVSRIVIPVGSGMSLAGLFTGMMRKAWRKPILGVVVGADPTSRLSYHAPMWAMSGLVSLVKAGVPYATLVSGSIGGAELDPVYEAKCLRFLRPGDLFWLVGRRTAAAEGEYVSAGRAPAMPKYDGGGSRSKWGS